MELKGYQRRSLDELEAYLALAAQVGAKRAFIERTERPYHAVGPLPELPYVCLRVPTGGGKTLLAAHAVGLAAGRLLHAGHVTVLWLAPSNTIVEQTLAALRSRRHPYREALDARFQGQVEVLTLAEALAVQRPVLAGATTVIVSTLAALRVEEVENRKVYETAGALSHHFSGLTAAQEALLERGEFGVAPHSLCNVLRLHRPLVVVDEAHNARTHLSFETLARFSPSCILEFTATPATEHRPESGLFASNVLTHVSALELKAEAMVKLPIELTVRAEWRQVVGEAVACRQRLEQLAAEEEAEGGGPLRPIVLLQAQPKRTGQSTLDVETVKACLLNDCAVPPEQVAVATGTTREIDGVDLAAADCPIRFIITVQALKEGWDCPFAYVLCSVAELSSGRAVEQILGRVLRLPGARRRSRAELNRAYAFVSSARFAEAAAALRDGLVANGCQKLEAEDLIRAAEGPAPDLWGDGGLFAEVSEPFEQSPDLNALSPDLARRVEWRADESRLSFTGQMTDWQRDELRAACASPADQEAVTRLCHASRGGAIQVRPAAVAAPAPLTVPQLALRVDGVLELYEDQHCEADWRLSQCEARLSPAEFAPSGEGGQSYEVDVADTGRLAVTFVEEAQQQLALLAWEPGWTLERLATWLDREIPHEDITQDESSLFIWNALTHLIEEEGVPLDRLAARKFRLRDALARKIGQHRRAAHRTAYQRRLFAADAPVEVSPAVCFRFDPETYAPNWPFDGVYSFRKHFHRLVGELKPKGEETECAIDLDEHPRVRRWVRNLDGRPDSSFWLPTSTDRFYPDFVAELTDGRVLAVEYKGAHLSTADDAREKDAVGRLWAARSGGRCLFVMITGPARAALDEVIGG